MELLQEFPFKIEHIKGSANSAADALTRADLKNNISKNYLQLLPEDKWTLNSVNTLENRANWPDKIKQYLEMDKWDKNI